jgi:hypothetical protein
MTSTQNSRLKKTVRHMKDATLTTYTLMKEYVVFKTVKKYSLKSEFLLETFMGRHIVRTHTNKSVTRLNLPTFIYTNLRKHEIILKTNTTLTCIPIEHNKLGNAGIPRSPELCHLWKAGTFPDGGFPTSDLCQSLGIHRPLTFVEWAGYSRAEDSPPSHVEAQKRRQVSCKVPVIVVQFQPQLECVDKFWQNSPVWYLVSWRAVQSVLEFLPAYGGATRLS